jgi:hypothetical protein
MTLFVTEHSIPTETYADAGVRYEIVFAIRDRKVISLNDGPDSAREEAERIAQQTFDWTHVCLGSVQRAEHVQEAEQPMASLRIFKAEVRVLF